MVQFVNIRELKSQLSEVIRRSRKGDVVVTSRGRPTAILHAISEEDLEDYLLAHSPKFLRSIELSHEEYRRKGGVSLEKLMGRTKRGVKRVRR